MKSTALKAAILLAAATLLSACVLGGSDTRYRLIAPQLESDAETGADEPDRTLAVARPHADRARDSTRILVRRDRVLMPWSGAAWIDRAPDLVQDLLVAHLDGRVATVGRYGSLPAEYRLDLVLRRFELVEGDGGLEADIAVVARLFDSGGGLLSSRRVTSRKPAGGANIDAAVSAMEAGMEAVFNELAGWLDECLVDARPDRAASADPAQ
ncbi:ABC-type transport auxiliary lipoprotein family protein [Wenzhouxiangella sediminis]|uniref:ABC-type transport auxiliary lipoprotein component domain-containing protein n=1 Tax=Wenzhouxiangella sediminis TaxID=1792836 RepID=A0A3E1KCF1_9GAMM|nr:ABC-type transport auxiliary lipoprotein family protein [Wenzhouxiangella sediminis]RFF32581.1 hypothetical protein DZC52_01160 [Wenzhouxiangella sediminis]